MQYKCLTIAGFDGSGGAGLQADLKVFSAFGCYGMTVLTALPIQNTCTVKTCYDLPLESMSEQLLTIFEDIRPDAIKIGMLFKSEIIECVADFLKKEAKGIPLVIDPVMLSKSGHNLLQPQAITQLKSELIPLATLITPNLPEAQALLSSTEASPALLANDLLKLGSEAVLVKGGHLPGNDSHDVLLKQNGEHHWLKSERIASKNTHGTGCTLSAAITACLARGFPLLKACEIAKQYLFNAIKASALNSVGKGQGPVNHLYHLESFIDQWLVN